MKNRKLLNDEYTRLVEEYVFDHPTTMSVLIGEGQDDRYEVLYANMLATNYFSSGVHANAVSFFGSYWGQIKEKIESLTNDLMERTILKWLMDGRIVQFELDIQRKEAAGYQNVYFLELREPVSGAQNPFTQESHINLLSSEEEKMPLMDELEYHLRRAIERDELKVYYQPQVDLRTGHISSFEALLRWQNEYLGFVSPGEFIPLAEQTGLIHRIGDWVLDEVCKQLNIWKAEHFPSVRVAVNISPKQLQMEGFIGRVRETIEKYGIRPTDLEMEITENALTRTHETAMTLSTLQKMGICISVDDFGTGYSSLSYLKNYPIDIIKIDRLFVQDLEVDEKNVAIAKMIINLAHSLDMKVVAEGVETSLQANILRQANCQKAQGFLFSKAVPPEEIVERYFC